MKFNLYLHSVFEESSIKIALGKINKSGLRGIVVLDKKLKLKGVLSDGDIRKALLKKISLSDKVKSICNKKFFCTKKIPNLKDFLKENLIKKSLNFIPIVDNKNRVKEIIRWEEVYSKKEKKIDTVPVVVMAGGEGTRLMPLTTILPKPLIPIAGIPMLEHILLKFKEQSFNNFLISINYKADLIKTFFVNKKKYKIKFLLEKKKLGTAGILGMLKKRMKTIFFLANCDTIYNTNFSQIQNFHIKNKNDLTLVVAKKDYKIPYGVCEINSNGLLKNIKEKPSFNIIVNTGLYLVSPKLLNLIPSNKKYDMTELIKDAGKKKYKISTYFISNNSWTDIGQKEELLNAQKNY
jgi:dTDP-glucose pyrophosphorylase